MDRMHAKPKDHLWVLLVIAACALIETFPSWVGIGAVSGFPKFGSMPTDWTLAVTQEAYWGYALYGGIVAPAGPRSRAFALWSAAGVFVLSLMGQASYHLMAAMHRTAPPQWVVVFVAALPVIVLALAVILIHLRHADRANAAEAERVRLEAEQRDTRAQAEAARLAQEEAAAADERTALRAQLAEALGAVEPLREQLEAEREESAVKLRDTQEALEEALRRAEALTQKLAGLSAQKKRAKAAGTRAQGGESDPTNELRAVMELRASPKLMQPRMSGELARALGLSPATGRRLHVKLVADGALTQYAQSLTEPLTERSAGPSDERLMSGQEGDR